MRPGLLHLQAGPGASRKKYFHYFYRFMLGRSVSSQGPQKTVGDEREDHGGRPSQRAVSRRDQARRPGVTLPSSVRGPCLLLGPETQPVCRSGTYTLRCGFHALAWGGQMTSLQSLNLRPEVFLLKPQRLLDAGPHLPRAFT